jgi:hypothetical protein
VDKPLLIRSDIFAGVGHRPAEISGHNNGNRKARAEFPSQQPQNLRHNIHNIKVAALDSGKFSNGNSLPPSAADLFAADKGKI